MTFQCIISRISCARAQLSHLQMKQLLGQVSKLSCRSSAHFQLKGKASLDSRSCGSLNCSALDTWKDFVSVTKAPTTARAKLIKTKTDSQFCKAKWFATSKQDELPFLAHPIFKLVIGRRPSAVHLYEAAMMKPLDLPKVVKQPEPGMFSQKICRRNAAPQSFIHYTVGNTLA